MFGGCAFTECGVCLPTWLGLESGNIKLDLAIASRRQIQDGRLDMQWWKSIADQQKIIVEKVARRKSEDSRN